jgi:hypothetical protein
MHVLCRERSDFHGLDGQTVDDVKAMVSSSVLPGEASTDACAPAQFEVTCGGTWVGHL